MRSSMIVLALALGAAGHAQDSDGFLSRDIVDSWFQKKNPPSPRPVYAGGKAAANAAYATNSVIGVTLWNLRAAPQRDNAAPGSPLAGFAPERVDASRPLPLGARARVSVESPREGFLYLIDREQHQGRDFGEAVLIFPNARLRGGDNQLRFGREFEIPGVQDKPPWFTVRCAHAGREADYTGEVLILVVTPKPLALDTSSERPSISEEQLRQWERQWGAAAMRYSLRHERERLFEHEELPPENLYVISTKPGEPFLLKVQVRLAR